MSRTNPKLPNIRTVEVGFHGSRKTGCSVLAVNAGTPIAEVMDEAGELLDGLTCLLGTIYGDGEANACELYALRFLASTASCMVTACSRALEQQEASYEHG